MNEPIQWCLSKHVDHPINVFWLSIGRPVSNMFGVFQAVEKASTHLQTLIPLIL